jgi:putative adhesin
MPGPRLSAFLILVLAPAPAAAQADDERWTRRCEHAWGDSNHERVCEVHQSGFHFAGGTLDVEPDANGGVEVEGWDLDSVAITLRVQAEAATAEQARALAGQVRIETGRGSIRVTGPSRGRRQQWSATLIVRAPRKTDLSARTENGPLSAEGLSGRLDLHATNGPVSLSRLAGEVRARVENGPLDVVLDGPQWSGRGLDAESVNGPVTLSIPEGYGAELETGTVNGPMQLDIPLTVTLQGRVRDRIRTTLGKGGPPVRVVTTNGPMTIRRARG